MLDVDNDFELVKVKCKFHKPYRTLNVSNKIFTFMNKCTPKFIIYKVGSPAAECEVEGFYDLERHVVYLHLQAAADTATLAAMCQQAEQDLTNAVSYILQYLFC